jgi:hypothetical protein
MVNLLTREDMYGDRVGKNKTAGTGLVQAVSFICQRTTLQNP